MAKVLILSEFGKEYPLAYRMAEEGESVTFQTIAPCAGNGKEKENFKICSSTPKGLDPDLVIGASNGVGGISDGYRKAGKVVLGGGALGDTLCRDREFLEKVVKFSKMLVPTVEEVIELKGTFLSLQIIGWFNGRQWIKPFQLAVKYNRFMEGDKGKDVNGMGSVLWGIEEGRLLTDTLLPLDVFLEKARYIGPVSVDVLVTTDSVYFIDFHTDLDQNWIYNLGELLKEKWFDFFHSLAVKTLSRIPMYKGKFSSMVKLSLPEHPGRDSANCLAHVTKPEGADHHIWLDGKDSFIGFTTAWGESPREAKRRVYRTVENMVLSPEVQYRRDIGETVELHINLLKGWGWI